MKLKDAFRAQNKLQALMDEASDILQDQGNTLKVTTAHLRSKVMPEAQDAVVEEAAPSEYAEHINQAGRTGTALLGGVSGSDAADKGLSGFEILPRPPCPGNKTMSGRLRPRCHLQMAWSSSKPKNCWRSRTDKPLLCRSQRPL